MERIVTRDGALSRAGVYVHCVPLHRWSHYDGSGRQSIAIVDAVVKLDVSLAGLDRVPRQRPGPVYRSRMTLSSLRYQQSRAHERGPK